MEITSALTILSVLSFTIILGYIGSLIFDRTRIPDTVWLLIFGLLVGPVFNIVSASTFLAVSPLLASIALLIILFESGLDMNFFMIVKEFPRAMLISVLDVAVSMVLVAAAAYILFGLNIYLGLFLGAIISGTCSAAVPAIVSKLKIKESVKTLLNLETVLTDPISIVLAIALLQYATATATNNIVHSIIASFSIGMVLGLAAGFAWLFILDMLKGKPFDYMLTLAALFMLYAFVESINGSGALAALFFGLVMSNAKEFGEMLRIEKKLDVQPFIKSFHKEISFFIKSFFFVYLGIVTSINFTYIIYGIVLSALLIASRSVIVRISTYKMALTKVETNIIKIMTPKGLTAAVLAQLALQYGFKEASMLSDLAFIVILSTVIYSSFAIRYYYKPQPEKA